MYVERVREGTKKKCKYKSIFLLLCMVYEVIKNIPCLFSHSCTFFLPANYWIVWKLDFCSRLLFFPVFFFVLCLLLLSYDSLYFTLYLTTIVSISLFGVVNASSYFDYCFSFWFSAYHCQNIFTIACLVSFFFFFEEKNSNFNSFYFFLTWTTNACQKYDCFFFLSLCFFIHLEGKIWMIYLLSVHHGFGFNSFV